jgi:hypothetical protein
MRGFLSIAELNEGNPFATPHPEPVRRLPKTTLLPKPPPVIAAIRRQRDAGAMPGTPRYQPRA